MTWQELNIQERESYKSKQKGIDWQSFSTYIVMHLILIPHIALCDINEYVCKQIYSNAEAMIVLQQRLLASTWGGQK